MQKSIERGKGMNKLIEFIKDRQRLRCISSERKKLLELTQQHIGELNKETAKKVISHTKKYINRELQIYGRCQMLTIGDYCTCSKCQIDNMKNEKILNEFIEEGAHGK